MARSGRSRLANFLVVLVATAGVLPAGGVAWGAADAPAGDHDRVPEEPPAVMEVPAPTPTPTAPTPLDAQLVEVAAALTARRQDARARLIAARVEVTEAEQQVRSLEVALAEHRHAVAALRRRLDAAAERRRRDRSQLRRLAVDLYGGGGLSRVAFVIESESFGDLARRASVTNDVLLAAHRDVREGEAVRRNLVEQVGARRGVLTRIGEDLDVARQRLRTAVATAAGREQDAAALEVTDGVPAGGIAFPVAGPTTFTDTFGAPRMPGTPFAHAHQGVDLFAAAGTPVVALERGTVVRVGTDLLGGMKLWLAGTSGARYYYAHLSGFAAGMMEGAAVEVGQPLGFVVNTGNAARTAPHLHFEVHPVGGPALNPYPLLREVASATGVWGPAREEER